MCRDQLNFTIEDGDFRTAILTGRDGELGPQINNLCSIRRHREPFGSIWHVGHDLTVVQHMADTIGVLYLGRLVEEAAPDALFEDPKHPYSQMLLAAAPKMDGFGREVEPPKGEIPDPISPPTGCAFHPRCPIAVERCARERPELRPIRGARVACHHVEKAIAQMMAEA